MRGRAAIWFALLAGTCLVPLGPSLSAELPAGASVAHGSVGITTPGANTMTIQQSSPAAIVNWQSFSVGAGASVDIRQPSASSALLNRVTGTTSSTIAGQIRADGQVYLVNPNGIMITPSGTVTAGGGFVASTLGISDEDFKAGRRNFAGTGASAPVVNQGTIEVGRGGYAALLGGSVENAGTISVPLGRVGLGAGERATLDISGDGFLEVAMPSGSAGEKALIQNSGRIRANGGRVELKAATAREVARQAINLSGVVEARTVGGRSGAIVLGGGAGGTVAVSGKLVASATRQGRKAAHGRAATSTKGGEITITGDRIGLSGATLDASGRTGGGTIRIGGDLQGKGALPHARSTVVDDKTTITADASDSGNGGRIVIWSDEFTGFGGLIRARGGAAGGDGGFAEVSSKGVLGYTGQTILTAPNGAFGTLLLDPYNITISTGATTTGPGPSFTPGTSNSVVNVGDLQNALATANVSIDTSGGSSTSGIDPGNITVAAPITWAQATTLTLNADQNIVVGQAISAPAGGLTLNANGNITATAAVNVGTFILQSGAWAQSGALPAFYATDFRLEGGSFLRVLGGDGGTTNPYRISDVYGLQGINTVLNSTGGLDMAQSYVLANDIDAAGTRRWTDGNTVIGFTPLAGSYRHRPSFAGTFDGHGYTISNLFIALPAEQQVGLFGDVSGSVQNLSLSQVDITGGTYVGALAGRNSGTIGNVRASGSVTGQSFVGGLAGDNFQVGDSIPAPPPQLTRAWANVAVRAGTGAQSVGGLVGSNEGSISLAYATGSVSAAGGGSAIGGLVGSNAFGSIAQAYAAGPVNGGTSSTSVGGLIGANDAAVSASFWDVTRTGQTQGIGSGSGTGAPTGLTTADFQNAATFVPLATAQGWSFETNWAPPSAGFYPALYALSPVIRAVIGDATRPYGHPNVFPLATSYGGPGTYVFGPSGDTVDLSTAFSTPATATSPVGSYPITGTGQTSALGIAYRVVATQSDATLAPSLTVTPAPLSLTANAQNKPYGTTFTFAGTEFSAAGLQNGETVGAAVLSSTGAPSSANAGLYPILIGSASGGTFDPRNYAITYVPGTMTVGQGSLVLTANDQSKTYGTSLAFAGTEFSVAGLQNGETIGTVQLSSPGAPSVAGVGLYPILIGSLSGGSFDPSNYTITYVPGAMTVSPAPLTLTANDQNKPYGISYVFGGTEFSAAGLQNGETVGSAVLSSSGAIASAFPGLYPILIGSAAGGSFDPRNYTITYVPGAMTVGVDPTLIDTPPAGNPTPLLPTTTVSLPNPPDTFDLGGVGGGSGGVGGGGPTLGTGGPELDVARSTLAAIENSSNDLESKVANCEMQFERQKKAVSEYKTCVGDALEQFADALDAKALTLPGPMRGIPAVIRRAARQVRAARTIQEARAAVGAAVAEVRKAIALIRADDPAIGRVQLQQANRIASALGSVETRLSRATGL